MGDGYALVQWTLSAESEKIGLLLPLVYLCVLVHAFHICSVRKRQAFCSRSISPLTGMWKSVCVAVHMGYRHWLYFWRMSLRDTWKFSFAKYAGSLDSFWSAIHTMFPENGAFWGAEGQQRGAVSLGALQEERSPPHQRRYCLLPLNNIIYWAWGHYLFDRVLTHIWRSSVFISLVPHKPHTVVYAYNPNTWYIEELETPVYCKLQVWGQPGIYLTQICIICV